MVGLEKTSYSVAEDDPQGVVEVCVMVYRANNNNCPIPFPFDVRISTVEDSEGIVRQLHNNSVCSIVYIIYQIFTQYQLM